MGTGTTMQLSDLMIAVRDRSDQLPTGYTPALTGTNYFVSEPLLIEYINQSAFALYDILVQKYGDDYFVAPSALFKTDGVSQSFPLPDGTTTFLNQAGASFVPSAIYKLLGVDLSLNGTTANSFITLKPFNFSSRNKLTAPNLQSYFGISDMRYREMGGNIWFTPIPQGGQTIQLWYIPRMIQLAALTDTLDGISGWTEYVIVDAAIKCMQKEESDCSLLVAQKDALLLRIEAASENRDVGSASTVSDTSNINGWMDGCGDNGFGAS